MDKIKIKDLEVYGKHGVLKEENVLGQKFLVSLTLFLDITSAGKQDALEHSVSYAQVAHFVNAFMKERTFKLLEAVAEHLSEEILLHFSFVEKVEIEIKKPWAPILLPLDTVSVEIERSWHKVYLALGSNMGDKEANLQQAIAYLEEDERSSVTKISSFIASKPMGDVIQEDFLNGAIELKTLRTPEEMLFLIWKIEEKLKRVKTLRWGPRTIDLDLIFYDDVVIQTEQLTIPHIGVQERDFVLIPLSEIAPQVRHPLLQQTVYQMKRSLNNYYVKERINQAHRD
ncbi:MAG: 2-amino-4-hydroxy-6-hydroxymethyldihydropteridine diphosphokinase [Velocimicrobium sp.]